MHRSSSNASTDVNVKPRRPDDQEVTSMSRVQRSLDVDDVDAAVAFYSRLFGTEPAKRRPGYANFAIAEPPVKLVLLENPGQGGTINHLGVEVESTERVHAELARLTGAGRTAPPGSEAESPERVHAEIARLTGAGLIADEEMGTTCCYATQDKAWLTGPGGERWEVYTVPADSAPSATSRQTLAAPR